MLPKIPPPKKTREKQWRTKWTRHPWCWVNRILLERFFFGCFRVGKNSPRPYCCHDTWQSSESHHHERCVARISSLRFFTHGYATWRFPPGDGGVFFFFFPGGEWNTLWTKTRNPPTNKQTSRKTIVERSIRTKPTPEISNDISRTRFEPVSSVRTFFTKIRFSLAKNMPPRSGFCSQKERLGTS